MATILGVQTVDSVLIISTDVNPATGAGTTAPTGTLCIAADGSGTFTKTGVAATAWQNSPLTTPPNTANSNTIVSSIVETNFTGTGITYIIPANTLAIGTKIKLFGKGIFSSLAAGVITIRLKIGATTILTTGTIALSAQTNSGWTCEATLTVRSIGVAGTISSSLEALFSSTGIAVIGEKIGSNGTQAINTTIANTLQISAQWTVSSASNSITIENIEYQILK